MLALSRQEAELQKKMTARQYLNGEFSDDILSSVHFEEDR
jgi:hypothetical protein